MNKVLSICSLIGCLALLSVCSSDCPDLSETNPYEEQYYSEGRLGTAFNNTATCYKQLTPAVEEAGLVARFKRGERLFENPFDTSTDPNFPLRDLGPLWLRASCIACYPGYGHGVRQTEYNSNVIGNGYLLVLTDQNDDYLSSLTSMPQTQAASPFKAPLNGHEIEMDWLPYTDEWGNKFGDGETCDLIYPEVTIPEDAFYVPLQAKGKDIPYSDLRIHLESTIGIYGTGLFDAISDEDLRAQYQTGEKHGASLNPTVWKDGDLVKYYVNRKQGDGTKYLPRYTYGLIRGSIQDGPEADAIWNITNVTCSDRRYHYMTTTYVKAASEDSDVQTKSYSYYPKWRKSGDVKKDIYDYLTSSELPADMTDEEYINFMVWHRGLAVPSAWNADSKEFQQGKKLFEEMGYATCHHPTWTTGKDKIRDPNNFFVGAHANLLPRYPHQKIWPYTDMIQHQLQMKNNVRTGWCCTTPLWGRGLNMKATGASDRLHDCRARTVIEAIMWHGAKNSNARQSIEKFRKLSKEKHKVVVTSTEST